MKMTSRNAFAGTITAITAGTPDAEVELTLPTGEKVYGQISNAVADTLGVVVGRSATFFVKATEILLAVDTDDVMIGCRNQFAGKVIKLVRGFVSGEVLVGTPSGVEVNANVTLDGVNRLKLERGAAVTALFLPSSVFVVMNK